MVDVAEMFNRTFPFRQGRLKLCFEARRLKGAALFTSLIIFCGYLPVMHDAVTSVAEELEFPGGKRRSYRGALFGNQKPRACAGHSRSTYQIFAKCRFRKIRDCASCAAFSRPTDRECCARSDGDNSAGQGLKASLSETIGSLRVGSSTYAMIALFRGLSDTQ